MHSIVILCLLWRHESGPLYNEAPDPHSCLLNNLWFLCQQDLDEVPKAEPVRAVKHCVWEPKEGMDECVALEGSYFYFSYSWYAGEWPSHDKFARNICTLG